jgi:two-component system chemotaxis response regulator CheY
MKKVLITDDSTFMREFIKKPFEELGFEVKQAEHGLEAIEYNKIEKFDFVTMDLTMPYKNGIETTKEILLENKNVKVIIISAMGQEHLVKKAISVGAINFIVKPFKQRDLRKIIEKILE